MVGFRIDDLSDLKANIRREWVLTNGIGGYAGGSVTGALNRTHQGYLIASLHPPVERFTALSKTEERIVTGDREISLSSSVHLKKNNKPVASAPDMAKNQKNPETASEEEVYSSCEYLRSFITDGAVSFLYEVGSLRIHKTIALAYGENKCVVLYRIENAGNTVKLIVTPLFNWHEHSCPHNEETIHKTFNEGCVKACAFSGPEPECGASCCRENNAAGCPGSGQGGRISLTPNCKEKAEISFTFSEGELRARSEIFDTDIALMTERDNETDGLECVFKPYDIVIEVGAGGSKAFGCICEVLTDQGNINTESGKQENTDVAAEAQMIISAARERAGELADRARRDPEAFPRSKHILSSPADVSDSMLFEALVQAADNFIAYRSSTGLSTVLAGLPWFTDWGRDTMIAFTGLTLVTGRFDDAASILKTFARYVKNGLVPNMFPDDGQEPLYNTADASLWYFYAVYKYLEYSGKDALEFIRTEIYPCLKQIIDGYRGGTGFSIHMDTDGLIHAGGGFDQVTWMDVRVGDWVATPRHGKPVEINALWYNALMIMTGLAEKYGDKDAEGYRELAGRIKESFRKKFWYKEGGYLFDVVDCDKDSLPDPAAYLSAAPGAYAGSRECISGCTGRENAFKKAVEKKCDPRLRPNQIYAVSLPFGILEPERERRVVDIVQEKLYTGCGLRSLEPSDPDYHPIYLGSLEKRDHAYHQGTAWGLLLGAFITAYVKTHGRTKDARREAGGLIVPVKDHLFKNCIGGISEIFDGDAPHAGRGCYLQAWSVGETLRCLYEDILQ